MDDFGGNRGRGAVGILEGRVSVEVVEERLEAIKKAKRVIYTYKFRYNERGNLENARC